MARTKQTARYSRAQKVPRKQLVAQRIHRSNSRSRSSSPSQQQVQINTQQFSVKFDNQKQCEKKAIPYQVVICEKCGVLLNSHSQITEVKVERQQKKVIKKKEIDDAKMQEQKQMGKKHWECQFCLHANPLSADFQKLPQQNPCYLVQNAHQGMNQEKNQRDEKLLIYCIDISGSMDANVGKKTRLQSVQQALCDQIKRMKFEKQKVKIGIITFGSIVTLYGKKQNRDIPQNIYNDFDQIVNHCKGIKQFSEPVVKELKFLKQSVENLTTYGSTALGPALVASIQLASTGPKGSKIILCTDGEANVGLNGHAFYTQSANFAKERGVVVNILSLKGDNCNLKELGKLTLSTGGSILKIDPQLLGSQFNKISKEEILGTESKLKIKVNHIFQIQTEDKALLSADKTILNQDYGSFTAETQLTFNFKILSKEEAQAKGMKSELLNRPKALMQVQLSYTNPSGSKYIQVITDYRLLSNNEDDLLKQLNFRLFAASTLQKVSNLIKTEDFVRADEEIKKYSKIVQEIFLKKEPKEDIEKFGTRMKKLENILQSKKNKKQDRSGIASKALRRRSRSRSLTKKKNRNQSESESQESNSDSGIPIARGRGRGRGRGGRGASKMAIKQKKRRNHSSQESESDRNMNSDSQEQVLYKEMRARSRSID